MFRRLTERLRALNTREAHGELTGHSTIALGCTACRYRTSVEVPSLGVGLTMNPPVPFSATVEAKFDSPDAEGSTTTVVSLNQQPCHNAEEGCPYGTIIPELAQRFRLNPTVLDMMVDPPTRTF